MQLVFGLVAQGLRLLVQPNVSPDLHWPNSEIVAGDVYVSVLSKVSGRRGLPEASTLSVPSI